MKRRTGILGVLIAILILGIGYAAISSVQLSVQGNGTINADQSNFQVQFDLDGDQPTKSTSATGATLEATYTNGTRATIKAENFRKAGDTATFVYTIVNKSETLDALLKKPVITNDNEDYFTVTAELANTELKAQTGKTTLTVTVKAIKTPVEENEEANISVKFSADPQN